MTIVLDGSSGITAPGGTAAAPSLTTSGDTNTGIFFPAADTIAFSEGGVEAMRIDSSGNLGIGTASPATKLDTAGTVRSTVQTVPSSGTGAELFYDATNAGLRGYNRTGSAYVNLALNDNMYVGGGSSGNVGIGTSSPTRKLTIELSGAAFPSASNPSIRLNETSSGRFAVVELDSSQNLNIWNGDAGSGSIRFYRGSGSGTLSMSLDGSGNLGLGVTPSAWSIRALQVGSGFAAWSTAVTNARIFANTYYDGAYKYVGTGRATQYEQDGYHAWYTAASGTAGNTVTFTQAMTLDVSGNLAVGTTNSAPANGTGMVVAAASTITRIDLRNSTTGTAQGDGTSLYLNGNDFTIENRESGFVGFATASTERARIDSSGNLGIGTSSPAYKLDVERSGDGITAGIAGGTYGIRFDNGGAFSSGMSTIHGVDSTLTASYQPIMLNGATVRFGISGTEVARFDTSGNLGIGTSSPSTRLTVSGTTTINTAASATAGLVVKTFDASGGSQPIANFQRSDAAINFQIGFNGTTGDTYAGTSTNHNLYFITNNTERARITSGGYFKASDTGTYASSTGSYHEFYQTNNSDTLRLTSTSSSVSGAYGLYVNLTTDPNTTDSFFIRCFGGANQRASIRANGGLANYSANDVNLSDERTKKDIVPLGSVWDKFKTIEIVKFKYRDQTHDDYNIGVIAQQLESVAPEFVDVDGFGDTPEDGVPFKTVYTTDMYHAAIKALQEAMTRIETLEAKVAALEGNN